MKKISALLLGASTLVMSASPLLASTGIFGTGVAISTDIGGTSAYDLFETTLLGDSRQAPYTSGGGDTLGAPTLVDTDNGGGTSTWAVSPASSGPSLGTFTAGTDTLTLDGGELLTYKNNGSDVTGADVFYSIDGGVFTDLSLSFNQDNVSGNGGDQRWYTDAAAVNILNGLSTGTHTLSIYFRDSNNVDTNDYVSNNSNNYNATFTIAAPAPEPSSAAMMIGTSVLGSLFMLRRKRR